MNNTPRILVAQENNFDYGPAEQFGTVEFVTAEDWSIFPTSAVNEKIASEVALAFLNYVPNHDFVVMTGSPLNIMIVTAEMLKYGPTHTILKFDNRTFKYQPVMMKFPGRAK